MNTQTGTITTVKRLHNSVNGNPRFEISVDGERFITGSDHAFCYAVGNRGFKVGDIVTLTLTRAGRISGMTAANGERA